MLLVEEIDRVAIQPIRAKVINQYNLYCSAASESVKSIDAYLREDILHRGKIDFIDIDLSRIYAYVYLSQHYCAFLKVLGVLNIHSVQKTLFVDIGCGCGTVALALRDFYQNSKINYIGYDVSQPMLCVAQEFLGGRINGDRLELLQDGFCVDRLTFVFSYIFGKDDVLNSIDCFINRINNYMHLFNLLECRVLILSGRYGFVEQDFIDRLVSLGMLEMKRHFYLKTYILNMEKYSFFVFRNLEAESLNDFIREGTVYFKSVSVKRVP